MGVLDTILIQDMVVGPVTVNSDYQTASIDISFKEAESSIQLTYNGGIGVDMEIVLEVSNDNVNFSPITDSAQLITEASGSHFIDIFGTGANYIRVAINVTSGSIDVQSCTWKGKRRH